ncbi:hypothetical protein ACP4OV_009038 [Aristida adscensionis]
MDSEVQVVESSLVLPSKATPRKELWLSPLDLEEGSRGHTPVLFFYRPAAAAAADFFDVARLKDALAKALVPFYPLAGRVDADGDGRVRVMCSGEGALFVVARSSLAGDDYFDDFKPSRDLRRLFLPRVEPLSVIEAIQVTFFRDGGVALGLLTHHAMADATSAAHFLQAWAALCRDGDAAAVPDPCHDRTLLRARSPPVVDPAALAALCPELTFSREPPGASANEVYVLSGDQVAALKRLAGGGAGGKPASTFCALSALVWQCACVARRLPPGAEARLAFPASVRRRVRPPLPDGYFGNAIIQLHVAGAAGEVASEPLAATAARVRAAVARVDDEVVRSAVDHHHVNAANGAAARRRWPAAGMLAETDVRINSWLGERLDDVDFGWGPPRVMSRAECLRAGFMYLMNGGPAAGDGAVRVVVCMEKANIREFQRLLYERAR